MEDHPIYPDWKDKDRRADQRSVRFSSPIYVEEPPAPAVIVVKRERSPTPPPNYDDPTPPRPYKTPRHDHSYHLDLKPSVSAMDPQYSGRSAYGRDSAPSLDVKVERDVQDGQVMLDDDGISSNQVSRSVRSHPPITKDISSRTTRSAGRGDDLLRNARSERGNPNYPPAPHREHSHPPRQSSSSSSAQLRARPTPPTREARTRTSDTANRHVISDARNQQNRNTRTKTNSLHDLLGSSKRVLDPDELFGSHIGQLKSEFFGRSVHETLYTEGWRDTLDSLDEGDEMREAIKTMGLLEIGTELLKRSVADLSVAADETRLLINHRILIPGTWKRSSIVGELMDQIRKLGGVVCHSEDELFATGARTYIHIVDLPDSSYIATESRYVERWTVQSCLGRLVRWCNAETLRKKPLNARLEILAAQCRKDRRETGLGREVYISELVLDGCRGSIRSICDFERFLIHDSFNSLDTSDARDRIMILAKNTSSRPSSQPNYPGEIRRMTVEDFYTYIGDIREKARRSTQAVGQRRMTHAERRFAKTLPPALGTDPIRL